MRRVVFTILFVFFVLLTALTAVQLHARTLIETRFSNVHVIIYNHSTLGTRVQIEADAENGVTPPRRIIFDITNQLTANQVGQAATAFNFILGQLGSQEGIPTPTPTLSATPTVSKTPTPVPTSTP